jgi:hypothetical protein
MNSLPFSQLTDDQRAQVAYLFADSIFGTDASAFAYELNDQGEVKGRSRIATNGDAANQPRARKTNIVQIHMIEEVNITDELIRHASMSMDALAASVAQRIYQSQSQTIQQQVENS